MIILMGEAYSNLVQPVLAIHYFEKYIKTAERSVIL
jgi:hypothetical protein